MTAAWTQEDAVAGPNTVRALSEIVCIDRERIYAVGQGRGGRMATLMPCEIETIGAIVTNAYRLPRGMTEPPCARTVPYMAVAQLADPILRPDGSSGCSPFDARPITSIKESDEWWGAHHGCDGKASPMAEVGLDGCKTWACRTPYVSCHLDGGRLWAKSEAWLDAVGCRSIAEPHPLTPAVWKFLQMHGATTEP